jgi:phage terminase large subunit-like protein
MAGALRRGEAWLKPGDVLKMWELWARDNQLPPDGRWRIWLLMGGRGAGKTRAGAEWLRGLVERKKARRVALVGPTLHDVREVMIEGPSGLKAVASRGHRPEYNVSRRRLEWRNGAVGYVFSAEDPDSLRGPQFDAVWCDEIGAWAHDMKTWDTMMFALRLGSSPRVAATTTPRPRALVKRLAAWAEGGRGGVTVTRAATRENAAHLASGFVAAMEEAYRGTETGRQELDGELIADPAGAIFKRSLIDAGRVMPGEAGAMERVVVAVDPPAGAGENSAACGIVCAGVRGGVVYVLEDASVRGLRPAQWAQRVMDVARRHGAGVVVAEANQGGEMVRAVIEAAGAKGEVRVKLRHAAKSKRDRAEPVSVEYEKGRVRHVGVLRELEDEMCSFGAHVEGEPAGPSPDRVDAMVWAVSELMRKPVRPGIVLL